MSFRHDTLMTPARVALAAILAAAPLVGGAQAQPTVRPVSGGALKYAEKPGVLSLNPYQSLGATGPTDRVLSMIYEPLFRYNFLNGAEWEYVLADGQPKAAAALKGGQSAFLITLKANVEWHDGSAVTAADVVFTYNYICNVAANKQLRENMARLIVDVRQGNTPQQVIFEFSRPVSDPRLELLDFIIPASRFQHPASFAARGAGPVPNFDPVSPEKDLDRYPLGTGPFKFDRREFGLPRLARFAAYHNTAAYLDSLAGHEYTDQSTMLESFMTEGGPIQMIVEVPPKSIPRIETDRRFERGSIASYNILAVGLRQKPGSILNDERTRRALTMAVNRDEILKNWYGGNGEVLASPIGRQSPFFDPSVKKLEYNAATAKAELAAAKVPPDARLVMLYEDDGSGSNTQTSDVAQSIKEAIEGVGIKVDLIKKTKSLFQLELQRGAFDMVLIRWELNPAYNIRPIFHSANAVQGGLNVMNFKDDQVDKWLEQYDEAADDSRRQNVMYALQKYLNQKAPAIYLLSEDKVYAYFRQYSIPPGTVDAFDFFTYAKQWWLNKR